METFKIVLAVLATQTVLYYLYNIYQKWSYGYHSMKEVINPFCNWTEAKDAREWRKGYYACEEKYKDLKNRVDRLEKRMSSDSEEKTKIYWHQN